MLKIICLLILLCYPITQGQDIEIEGVMRVGDSFLHQLNRNLRVKFRSENNENSKSESRKAIDSSETNDTNKKKAIKSESIESAPRNQRFVMREDSIENIDSNKVDDAVKPVQKNDESYDGEAIDKFLDTDKPDDDSDQEKRIIHKTDENEIKSSDESNSHPKILDNHFSNNLDGKKDIVADDNNLRSNKNEEKNEEIIIKQIIGSDGHSKNKNIANNEDMKVPVTRRSKYEKHYAPKTQTTGSGSPLLRRDHPLTKKFLKHVIFGEVENIDRIARRIEEKITLNKSDADLLLKTSRNSYTTKMEGYVNYINSKQEPTCDIDREYMYLDIVESSNILLFSEARKLLNSIIDKSRRNISMYDLETVTQSIYEEHVNHKKRAIFNICQELNICRSYPGFSDYFAELISEVLKLSDTRLGYLVKASAKLTKNRDNFFKAFMKDSVAELIGERLDMISKDMFNFREMFSIIRSIIMQRFKLMKTTDEQLRVRTKAVRLLIDIVDKTFSLAAGIDLTAMTFDTTVKGIRHWALGKRDEVETLLKLLLEHIVAVIHVNWNEFVTEEVSMLTEVIMTGKTDMTIVFNELFARGSQFVRYDIVESD